MLRQPTKNPVENNEITLETENVTTELEKQIQENIIKQQQKTDSRDLQIHRTVLQNLNTQSDITEESYAESSSSTLQRIPCNKHYMSTAIRQMMEKRRIVLQNLPANSSDSSFEEDCMKRTRIRFLRRKSKLERDIFWRKYNDFLARSIDYMESTRSSSSDSEIF